MKILSNIYKKFVLTQYFEILILFFYKVIMKCLLISYKYLILLMGNFIRIIVIFFLDFIKICLDVNESNFIDIIYFAKEPQFSV